MTLRIMTAACVVTLAALRPLSGQQGTLRTLADDPGAWKPWSYTPPSAADLRTIGASAAESRAFESRVRAVADVFRAAPAWNPLRGVDALLSGMPIVPPRPPRAGTYRPMAAYILLGSYERFVVVEADGREHDKQTAGETSLVMITINSLPQPGRARLTDADGAMAEEPVRTGEFGGFPTYADTIVVTTNGRPVWTPVSMERALKAAIAQRKGEAANAETYIAEQERRYAAFIAPDAVAARQAKYKDAIDKVASKGAAAVEHERRYWERDEADQRAALEKGRSRDPKVSRPAAVIAGLKAAEDQLAALTPAAAAAQACYLDPGADALKTGVVSAGTPGCKPLVSTNPGFFDAQLPPSAPQIVVASRFADLEKGWKLGRAGAAQAGQLDRWTTYEVLRQADWRKIADLLGK